jgi:anti-sigma factor (TIGR02949 family)
MSACDDYRSLVPLFLDHELLDFDAEDFREHIATCADCRQLLAEEQTLSRLLHRSRPLYQTPEALRARVPEILMSAAPLGVCAPKRMRKRILRILASPLRGIAQPSLRWKELPATPLVTILAILFIPQTLQRVRANSFVETAAETHRSYLEGNLPMEIHTSSLTAITAWFAGKVPFHFELPASQQWANGSQIYRLTGARLINFRGAYAALTTYEMQSQKISLLVVSEKSARAEGGEAIQSDHLMFHDHKAGNFDVITWNNHGLTYALVSSLPGSGRHSCLVCHQNMADHFRFSLQP